MFCFSPRRAEKRAAKSQSPLLGSQMIRNVCREVMVLGIISFVLQVTCVGHVCQCVVKIQFRGADSHLGQQAITQKQDLG
jgi:hypothetical protein